MGFNSMLKISVTAILAGGMLIGLTACGAKQQVKPEPIPEVAAEPEPTPEPEQAMQRYSVVRGDTLWDIAGRRDIYSDNFQWPLIFKANRDQIQDPDIIEIGQDLAISHEFSQREVAQAIDNAKRTPRYQRHTTPRKRLPIEY